MLAGKDRFPGVSTRVYNSTISRGHGQGPKTEVNLAGAEDDLGPQLLHRDIQSKFNGTMILDAAKFGPSCALAAKHGLEHEFCVGIL